MDNFPIKNIGLTPTEGQLTQDVTALQGYSGIYTQPTVNSPFYGGGPAPSHPGFVDSLFSKLQSIGKDGAHLIGGATEWLAKSTFNMGRSVLRNPVDLYRLGEDNNTANHLNSRSNALGGSLDSIMQSYKAGFMTPNDFKDAINQWEKDNNKLSHDLQGYQLKLKNDAAQSSEDIINAGAAVITIMTGGLTAGLDLGITGASEAAGYLSSAGARAMLAPVETTVSRAATDAALMKSLTPAVQDAIKGSLYRVFVNSSENLSAGQTARAVAANVALKYPLGYAAISSTAQQTYKDLQNDKYGDAIKNLAFNATLLLSGGPIGWGVKQSGRAAKATSVAMGLRPGSMLDEFSSYIANGDRRALAKIASQKIASGQDDEVKSMIVALESNLKRAGGIPGQAVYQIVDHLENYVGWGSLKNMTHQEAWDNVVNYWKTAEDAQKLKETGKIAGIARHDPRPIVPLRWTNADKSNIANIVEEHGKQGWQAFTDQYPNTAAANNVNLRKQISNILETKPPEEWRKAIMSISALPAIEGVPKADAKIFADRGYVLGTHPGHNLPVVKFEDTSGKLATTLSEENDFFVRSGSPVPVLKTIGSMLTHMGLSPEASTQRVYDVVKSSFTSHLDQTFLDSYGSRLASIKAAKAAATTTTEIETAKDAWAATGLSAEDIAYAKKFKYTPEEAVRKFGGGEGKIEQRSATAAETKAPAPETNNHDNTGDYILKRLRNYMAKPTRGGIVLGDTRVATPITDLRQLTVRDVKAALAIGGKELDSGSAHKVMDAIMQAHLDAPFAVASLGGKAMDVAYRVPGYKKFMRLIGAGHFTWNPFFRHGRLPFKSEILSQMEAGGKFPTIPGTNWAAKLVFNGRYQEYDNIVQALRDGKLLPSGLGAEAADIGGVELASKFGTNYPKEALYPVASLISSAAKKVGLSSEDYIRQNPQEVSDMAQTILHYDRRNSFLNSPLVRTLNIAFFPARFNIKVASLMARTLSRQAPIVQFAFLKGTMEAPAFFQSPQGQAWYSQNSDIIGLVKYLSPLETVASVSEFLSGVQHGDGKLMVAGLGEMGGLPFGWIPMMLESQGLIDMSVPYINPKSGQVSKDYIPVSVRGRLGQSVQDLLTSLYSFPGSTVGLPSKTGIASHAAAALTKSNTKTDFRTQTPTLSPEQQSFQNQVLNTQGISQPTSPTAQPPYTQPTVVPPTENSANTAPIYTASELRSKSKVKKSNEPVSPLPGQTAIGQVPNNR